MLEAPVENKKQVGKRDTIIYSMRVNIIYIYFGESNLILLLEK